MSKYNFITKTVGVIAAMVMVLSLVPVRADQNTVRGLILSPAIQEIDGDRGNSYDLTVNLENDSQGDSYSLTPIVQTFVASDKEGEPVITALPEKSTLSSWVSFADQKIELKQGEKKESKVKVMLPQDAQPGSYYFALTYSDQKDNTSGDKTKVVITKNVAALLFVTVKGQVQRDVTFDTVTTDKKVYDPLFDGIQLSYKMSLKGNAYLKPSGNIVLGKTESPDGTLPINPNQKIILPNSSRTFAKNVAPQWNVPLLSSSPAASSASDIQELKGGDYARSWFGSQVVSARVVYPNGNGELQQKTVQTEVFFFPWKTLLVLALVAGIVAAAVYFVRRSKKEDK